MTLAESEHHAVLDLTTSSNGIFFEVKVLATGLSRGASATR